MREKEEEFTGNILDGLEGLEMAIRVQPEAYRGSKSMERRWREKAGFLT